MNISNQNPTQVSDKMPGLSGKKNKKESMMDALMKLGDGPIPNAKKGKAVFSMTDAKKKETTAVQPPVLEQLKNGRKAEGKNTTGHEIKQEMKVEGFSDKKTEKTEKREHVSHPKEKREDVDGVSSILILTQPQFSIPKATVERKENGTLLVNQDLAITDKSKQGGRMPLSMADIKQEQQIQILRGLAKQLSDPNIPNKQEAFSLPEQGVRTKTTFVQLTLETTTKSHDIKKSGEQLSQSVGLQLKEPLKDAKKIKETDGLKADGITLENKLESPFRNTPTKVESVRDVRSLITQEIEQYIEFKEVNSKKVTMSIQHEEIGNMEIQIEKKDNKIYIHLRVEELTSKERMEHTLEQLKNEMKEKEIDVEYEVEQEGEQKEKRKEQQELTEKEKKRENQSDEDHHTKFDELLEVSP